MKWFLIVLLIFPAILKGQDFNREELIKKNTFYKSMEISYIILNTLDLFTTFYALEKNATEANPIANLYIKNKPLTILIKSGTTLFTLYSLNNLRKHNKKTAYMILGGLNILYSLILYNNIKILSY